jgi:hypothetical protein
MRSYRIAKKRYYPNMTIPASNIIYEVPEDMFLYKNYCFSRTEINIIFKIKYKKFVFCCCPIPVWWIRQLSWSQHNLVRFLQWIQKVSHRLPQSAAKYAVTTKMKHFSNHAGKWNKTILNPNRGNQSLRRVSFVALFS